ncbi:hypothetical protein C8J56DRAFT_249056 [Mycena floridula]|nr:hypothetical protein C8J56DRAFT_249056 [Mycena floridula]
MDPNDALGLPENPLSRKFCQTAISPTTEGLDSVETIVIAAVDALEHVKAKMQDIRALMASYGFQPEDFAVRPGFTEQCILDGFGHLQQIFMLLSIDPGPDPAFLVDLGKIFAPFPGTLYTPSQFLLIPLFDKNGERWLHTRQFSCLDVREGRLISDYASHNTRVASTTRVQTSSSTGGGYPSAFFHATTELFSSNSSNPFQKLEIQGQLTSTVFPRPQYETCSVQVLELNSHSQPFAGRTNAYQQRFAHVSIDSCLDYIATSRISRPETTTFASGAAPIIHQHPDGRALWHFSVEDPQDQRNGFAIPNDRLPSVDCFEALGDVRFPDLMTVEVASYWTMIDPFEAGTWDSEDLLFHNLCQVVVMKLLFSNQSQKR